MFLNTIKSAVVFGIFVVVLLVVLPLWLSFYDYGGERRGGIGKIAKSELERKFDSKASDVVESDSGDDQAGVEVEGSGRPFEYIGDIDPTKPLPWPKKEADWWALHELLAKRVAESDSLPPISISNNEPRDKNNDNLYFPQLIFYGDSITEGWNGTSFGDIPGEHRMWSPNEPALIRQIFDKHFGQSSVWGRKAARPPLVLGISGSKTYDFIWRVENGEFPVSRIFDAKDDGSATAAESETETAANQYLERIFIILMGTNNLGGGMLPEPTIRGMDAVGRTILQKLRDRNASQPAAILFSELLPRRDDFRARKMCPPRCKNEKTLEPFSSFMPAIEKVNRALPDVLDGWRRDYPESKIVLLSSKEGENGIDDSKSHDMKTIFCGSEMFAMERQEEFDLHMPDHLHPNAKGYDLWARCIKRGLEAIMDGNVQLLS